MTPVSVNLGSEVSMKNPTNEYSGDLRDARKLLKQGEYLNARALAIKTRNAMYKAKEHYAYASTYDTLERIADEVWHFA